MTKFALMRAASLIKSIAGGEVSSEIQQNITQEFPPHNVRLNLNRLNSLIGNDIPVEKVAQILELLEIKVVAQQGDDWNLEVPTYRADVTREADVVEEILRIYGFNNIELPTRMHISISDNDGINASKLRKTVASFLTGNGYSEIMNNSLTKESYYQKFNLSDEAGLVRILNPLSQDLGVMRQTLLYGGLEVVTRNLNRQTNDIKVFEFGNIYFKDADGEYREEEKLMVLLSGNDVAENWNYKPKTASIYNLKGVVSAILERMGVSGLQENVNENNVFDDTLVYGRGDKEFARLGQVNSNILAYFEIDQPVFVAFLDVDSVFKAASRNKISYQEIPRFQWVRRDLALLVDQGTQYEGLKIAAKKAGGKLLKEVNLFDVYTGKNLPDGKKSYAMSFILQDPQETLTDKRIEVVMSKIQTSLKKQFGAELR
jgi:phenylalanyl-tRNA synthetase beta chain